MQVTIGATVTNHWDPAFVTVTPGSTVTWAWSGTAQPHNVDVPGFGTSAGYGTSGSFSVTFPSAGQFGFTCDIHPTMTGAVTVQ